MTDLSRSSALIQAKVTMPRSPSDLVQRGALTAKLDAGQAGKLTLVCAPAGFGKTTAVADWLQSKLRTQREPGQAPGEMVAWLTLDGAIDLSAFVAYLAAAIRTVQPDACAGVTNALGNLHLLSVNDLAALFVSDLEQIASHLIAVLDDYHLIADRDVHQFLEFVIRHQPAHFHFVIVTRVSPPLPLARLRADRELCEVRAPELCFQRDEARQLLCAMLNGAVTPAMFDAIYTQTAGWPVGLRLSGLAIQAESDFALGARVPDAANHHFLFEFLTQEVLAGLPENLRTFLLTTSILPDLNPSLCDAVLGSSGLDGRQHSGECLRQLLARNLLISQIGDRPNWYRYHLQFQRLLRSQLHMERTDDEIKQLYARAAAWYARHGHVQESVRACMAAGEPERAADTLELALPALYGGEELTQYEQVLDLLPASVLDRRPALLMLQCWMAQHRGQWAAMPALAEKAQALVTQGIGAEAPTSLRTVQGEIYAALCSAATTVNSVEQQASWAERSLALLPADYAHLRGRVLTELSRIRRWQGRPHEAAQLLDDALQVAGLRVSTLTLFLLQALVLHRILMLQLEQAQETARTMARLAEEGHLLLSRSSAEMWLGIIACLRHEPDQAARQYEFMVTHSAQTYLIMQLAMSYFCLLAAQGGQAKKAADGPPAAPDSIVVHLRELVLQRKSIEWLAMLDAIEAMAALAGGNQDKAVQWALSHPAPPLEVPVPIQRLIWVRCLLAAGDAASLGQAEAVAREMVAACVQQGNALSALECRVLLGLISHAQGKEAESLQLLAPAVVAAAASGAIVSFFGHEPALPQLLAKLTQDPAAGHSARRLLDQIAPAQTRAAGASPERPRRALPSGELLTRREIEMLQLLDQRLSNSEIGEQLVLSPHTVRNHLASLFAKLGVHTRNQALQRAGELGLLHETHQLGNS